MSTEVTNLKNEIDFRSARKIDNKNRERGGEKIFREGGGEESYKSEGEKRESERERETHA